MAETVKNLPAAQKTWIQSLGQKDPWRNEWLPTPLFLPGEFHGERSLAGYSPWLAKMFDITERLTHTGKYLVVFAIIYIYIYTHTHTYTYLCIQHTQTHSSVLVCVLVAQSCPTLCDPMDHSLPGPSAHGILQAVSFFGGSSQPRE